MAKSTTEGELPESIDKSANRGYALCLAALGLFLILCAMSTILQQSAALNEKPPLATVLAWLVLLSGAVSLISGIHLLAKIRKNG